jgi:hypothetical protein
MLRGTVAASLLLGLLAIAASALAGHPGIGISLAAGLAIGSTNGYLMVATINQRAPFVPASFFRLALLTGAALIVALLLHATLWAVALGVGAAQLVMTAVGVREGLRQ